MNSAHPPAGESLDKLLLQFAAKYIWWKEPAEAIAFPNRIAAQVMDLGVFEDAELLFKTAGAEALKEVIRTAQPGNFGLRSWNYWHYRLGLAELDEVPPLPRRSFE